MQPFAECVIAKVVISTDGTLEPNSAEVPSLGQFAGHAFVSEVVLLEEEVELVKSHLYHWLEDKRV